MTTLKTINPLKELPPEIINLIYEYARDDTAKKNFVKIFNAWTVVKNATPFKQCKLMGAVYNGNSNFSMVINEKGYSSRVFSVTLSARCGHIESVKEKVPGYEGTTREFFHMLLECGNTFWYDHVWHYWNNDMALYVLMRELTVNVTKEHRFLLNPPKYTLGP